VHPDIFAMSAAINNIPKYEIGECVCNISTPEERYIIHQLFKIDNPEEPENPYVAAVVKNKPNANWSSWFIPGTMRMIKLASIQKQYYVPCSK
jgi:hypothetical protein